MNKKLLLGMLILGFCNGVTAAGAAPGQDFAAVSFRPGTPPPKGEKCLEAILKHDHTASDYLGSVDWACDLGDRQHALTRGAQDVINNPDPAVLDIQINYLKECARKIFYEIGIISSFIVEKQKNPGFRFSGAASSQNGITFRYWWVLSEYSRALTTPVFVQYLFQHIPHLNIPEIQEEIERTLQELEELMGLHDIAE